MQNCHNGMMMIMIKGKTGNMKHGEILKDEETIVLGVEISQCYIPLSQKRQK